MGFCYYFRSYELFIVWAFFTRLIQGISSTFLKLITLIIAKRLFHNHFAILVELRSTVTTLFVGLGPLFAAELGDHLTFDIVLYIASAIGVVLILPFAWKIIPTERCQFSAAKIATEAS